MASVLRDLIIIRYTIYRVTYFMNDTSYLAQRTFQGINITHINRFKLTSILFIPFPILLYNEIQSHSSIVMYNQYRFRHKIIALSALL